MSDQYLAVENLRGKLPENAKGGIKDDSSKIEFSLLPWGALEKITKVLMHGARKYDRDNWRKVERIRYEDSMIRHYKAWRNGEALDLDTKEPHLAHMGCCLLFLLELYEDNEISDAFVAPI